MAVIIPGAGGATREDAASGAKILGGSLRFDSASSHYLNRTPASAGSARTFTLSAWVKIGSDGSVYKQITFLGAGTGSQTNAGNDNIQLRGDGTALRLGVLGNGGVGGNYAQFTAYHRDPSGWQHVVFSIDTTQATQANRCRVYFNGIEETAYSANAFSLDYNFPYVNTTSAHVIGRCNEGGGPNHTDAYLTELHFIDGYAYDSSYFGFTDPLTNTWRPKKYTGEYGTNGFYLPFDDDNAKGTDRSGKGNNWTANNFTGTSTSPDVVPDSPSGISYSTVPTVGIGTTTGLTKPSNYATLNPLDYVNSTFSNGNLDTVVGTGSGSLAFGNFQMKSGKWYWEITPTSVSNPMIGVADGDTAIGTRTWQGANAWYYYVNGQKYNNSTGTAYGASFTTNDVIGVAYDADNGSLVFYKNGTSQGTAFTGLSGKGIIPALNNGASATSEPYTANFGQRPFKYTPPTGFLPLCTANLPRPTIVRPDKFVGIVTYTGNVSTRSITGLEFQPDFVWVKRRSTAAVHGLWDSVRGASKYLVSNNSDQEQTDATNGVQGFQANGFDLGATATWNGNNETYVAWAWKAGGQIGVGRSFMINNVGFATAGDAGMNTGTVAPTSASVNTKSGFSIVTYTGTGANATISHGLGVAPKMMIVKNRTTSGTSWAVYTQMTGAGNYLRLNSTIASTAGSTFWNSTAPTSSVFSVGTDSDVNANTQQHVAYLWSEVAGFSKIGSYTGNGSSDGPFVFLGFKPRWLMIKRSDSTESWLIFDTARETYNPTDDVLWANLSNAESANYTPQDFTSNGFKIRTSSTSTNASGGTYIFAAYAESPTQNLFGGQSSAR